MQNSTADMTRPARARDESLRFTSRRRAERRARETLTSSWLRLRDAQA